MKHKYRCYGKIINGQGREWRYHEYYTLANDVVMKVYGIVLLNDLDPDFIQSGINIEKRDTLARVMETASSQPVSLRELGQILNLEML